jgi:hypothetical protein
VCLTCGVAQFHVPHRELRVLKTGFPVDGASILIENGEHQNGLAPWWTMEQPDQEG